MVQVAAIALRDALSQFQKVAPAKDPAASQQMLQKFVRYFGPDRLMKSLKPIDIETFGQSSGVDALAKLAPVKDFLKYADGAGLTVKDMDGKGLDRHLKVKRSPIRVKQSAHRNTGPTVRLSPEGHKRAVDELDTLKAESLSIADDIKKAMADKDFRENAPLDAARDKQAHTAARIRDLEETLRFAEIIQEDGGAAHADAGRSRIGSHVVVWDMLDNENLSYVLVDPKEVNSAAGRISVESPVGKALLNRRKGDIVEVKSPSGSRKYRVDEVEGFNEGGSRSGPK